MITLKSAHEIELMRRAGKITGLPVLWQGKW